MAAETFSCRLLSRQWRDGPRGVEITLWGVSSTGPVKVDLDAEPVMFVARTTAHALTQTGRRQPVELVSPCGDPVDAVYFKSQRALTAARDLLRSSGLAVFESDVKPSDRYVMERFVTGAFEITGRVVKRPRPGERGVTVVQGGRVRALERPPPVALSSLSFDIETDGPQGALLSIAIVFQSAARAAPRTERVIVIGAGEPDQSLPALSFVRDERALLDAFLTLVRDLDPDVLTGWNVIEFDLTVLEKRCEASGLAFLLGRNGERARVLPGDRGQVSIARVPGRVVLDGIATLRNATFSLERYTLEHVAQTLLGRGKRIDAHDTKRAKVGEIRRMAREDPVALAAYNLEDARLVADIFDEASLLGFACARADLVGLPLDRQGGSVAAFDHLYLPRLHRSGLVAFDVEQGATAEPSPGGEVFAGVAGLHRDVLAFDFRSLYPSIIRTFRIDPLGLYLALGTDALTEGQIAGFDGARFTKSPSILPDLIARLAEARKQAQATDDEALSRAIKVQMASFYGVLGTPGCRFFDPRLASSITKRGHQIIRGARAFFEERGYAVLYGDTDSLFVDVRRAAEGRALFDLGRTLAAELNESLSRRILEEHGLESALELRFDLLFSRFLMPKLRSGEGGSKKRYAGVAQKPPDGSPQLVIKGLEAVRTDWTPFARRVQRELLQRVFADEPWHAWLLDVRAKLLAGAYDAELVYRKKLRRDLDAYAAAPPHVRAARLVSDVEADDEGIGRDDIAYLVTTKGPLPVAAAADARIDYDHYIDKQLAPACDVVLTVMGSSFDAVAGAQLGLF